MKNRFSSRIVILFLCLYVSALNAAEPFVSFISDGTGLPLFTQQNRSFAIWCDEAEHKGVISRQGGYEYKEKGGVVVMEAERFAESTQGANTQWTLIPDLGRTLSGLSLMPYTQPTTGASLTYRMNFKSDKEGLRIRLILDRTLPKGRTLLCNQYRWRRRTDYQL